MTKHNSGANDSARQADALFRVTDSVPVGRVTFFRSSDGDADIPVGTFIFEAANEHRADLGQLDCVVGQKLRKPSAELRVLSG